MGHTDPMICRCEEVSLEQLRQVASTYQCSARELKLRTRAGMGYCGGRTCRPLIEALLVSVSGQATGNPLGLGYQPPVRPVSFYLIGEGRGKTEENNRSARHADSPFAADTEQGGGFQ